MYTEGISASPTSAPSFAEVDAWYLSSSFGTSGTSSEFGASVSMYGELFAVGSPSGVAGAAVRSGFVSVFDVYGSDSVAQVSYYV